MKLTDVHIKHIVSLERDGRITPEIVLADARQSDSPIHELYDWDVEKAANAHWLERSREIIRQVKMTVVVTHETYAPPRYVRDPEIDPRDQGYRSIPSLRLDPSAARDALIQELTQVASRLRRAKVIAQGLGLENEIEDLLARVTGLRAIFNVKSEVKIEPEVAENQIIGEIL